MCEILLAADPNEEPVWPVEDPIYDRMKAKLSNLYNIIRF